MSFKEVIALGQKFIFLMIEGLWTVPNMYALQHPYSLWRPEWNSQAPKGEEWTTNQINSATVDFPIQNVNLR